MKVTIQNTSKCQKTLDIQVEGERVQQEYDRFYSTIAPKANVPGFRQGKAPRSVLEIHYQQEAQEEVLKKLISESYGRAIRENQISPVTLPKVEGIQFSTNGLSYKAVVETRPEVKLPRYTGLRISKPRIEVKDEEIIRVIEDLRQRQAQFQVVEDRAVQKGDFVVHDFVCTIDGKIVDTRKDQWLEVGNTHPLPQFSENLVGMKAGEQKTFTFALPPDFPNKSYQGKEATFQVTLKEIKVKKLPELGEDFLKATGDFSTLDDLKSAIRLDLEEMRRREAERAVENDLVQQLLEKCRFDLPPSLVKERAEALVEEGVRALIYRGVPQAEAVQKRQELEPKMQEEAQRQLRAAFILEEIAEKENLRVADSEVNERLTRIAKKYNQQVEQVREAYEKQDRLGDLTSEIQNEKVLTFLKEKAEIKELEKQ